jgi:two-component system, NarL family, response regulator LiaR
MTESTSRALKVLIVEDHELARNGLVFSLNRKSQFNIVGEAENGEVAIRLCQEKHPDVILMDIGMPVMDGIEATHKIKKDFPHTKVVILTSHQDGEEVYASLAAGADAYCMKDIRIERLIHIMETVYDGAIWLDPAIARMVMDSLMIRMPEKSRDTQQSRQRYNVDLTERELEVLKLIVEGRSNKEIADILVITVHTAKAHVGNIMQKLAVDDRTQAAVKAIRDGLVQPVKPQV